MQQNYYVPLIHFAANYDCSAYGAGAYDNNACATTSAGSNPVETLADTGYNIIIPVALGLALIVAGAVLLAKRLIRRKNTSAK